MYYSRDDIKKLGTILTIWAHPDDETWCAGGLLAAARVNDQRVICVTATCGDAGRSANESRWPQADLAKIRTTELAKALKTLGITEHHQLKYVDGTLPNCEKTEAIQTLADLIKQYSPDTIVSFGAEDGITGHTDHCTVGSWVRAARQKADSKATLLRCVETTEKYNSPTTVDCNKRFHIYLDTAQPILVSCDQADICFVLPDTIRDQKLRALHDHACQTTTIFADPAGRAFMNLNAHHEAFMEVIT